MSEGRGERLRERLGPGAFVTFGLAGATAVVGLGLPVAWRLRQVVQLSRRRDRCRATAIVVLGQRLRGEDITEAYRRRLDRAAELWRVGLAPRIIVTGGRTGPSTRSEAEAGRDFLLAIGLPTGAIVCEDGSRHTLENLFNVRATLDDPRGATLLLVTSPLHLARAAAIARGLSLRVALHGAPGADPPHYHRAWWRAAWREAYMLHWYHTGMLYSRTIRSRRLLSRVT